MKTTFALIFCVSVMLLLYLSGALAKTKPEMFALQDFSVYDRIECTQDCADKKALGNVQKGETLKVLAQIKGKTKTVLRLESENTAGWIVYDEALMQKKSQVPKESKN